MRRSGLGSLLSVVLAVGIILGVGAPAFAKDQGPGDKAYRGMVNLTTGWLEIFKNIGETTHEYKGNFFLGLTWGTTKGIGASLVRMGNGLWETLSYPWAPYGGGIQPPTMLFYGGSGRTGATK